jgi:hypothetical protein
MLTLCIKFLVCLSNFMVFYTTHDFFMGILQVKFLQFYVYRFNLLSVLSTEEVFFRDPCLWFSISQKEC